MSHLWPETRELLVTFVKTLIQFYLLCLFICSLTYYIKEVIKSKIVWIVNKKVLANDGATS